MIIYSMLVGDKMECNLEVNLNKLYKHRRFALVGTLSCVCLITTNMVYATDTQLTLLMGSVISFPSFVNYLVDVQKEINKGHTLKKEMHFNKSIIEDEKPIYN